MDRRNACRSPRHSKSIANCLLIIAYQLSFPSAFFVESFVVQNKNRDSLKQPRQGLRA